MNHQNIQIITAVYFLANFQKIKNKTKRDKKQKLKYDLMKNGKNRFKDLSKKLRLRHELIIKINF